MKPVRNWNNYNIDSQFKVYVSVYKLHILAYICHLHNYVYRYVNEGSQSSMNWMQLDLFQFLEFIQLQHLYEFKI